MGLLTVPDRALSSETEKDPSGGIFSNRQKSLVVMIKVFIFQEHTVKRCSTRARLFLIEEVRPLQC